MTSDGVELPYVILMTHIIKYAEWCVGFMDLRWKINKICKIAQLKFIFIAVDKADQLIFFVCILIVPYIMCSTYFWDKEPSCHLWCMIIYNSFSL
jgi:hypothetical protein